MAILVAAGGAALGTALGVGPGAGWLAGAALGNLLFPTQGPDNRVEGPRLGDLTVTSSAYGAPIAIAYGTLRMAGNMIWSSGITEQRKVSRSSGGKGGGGATQTAVSYSYTASFAIAFGGGPAEDVVRLWADGKLLYDKSGASPEVAKQGLRFRFHPGSEDQLPDPLIEAHVGDGRAPAHRGLCYLVFEDLPLGDFGNRIPNLTAEITFRRGAAQPYQLLDFITTGEGGLLGSYQINELAIDWRRGHGWFLSGGSDPATTGLRRFDLRTMREDRQVRMTDVADASPNNYAQRTDITRRWITNGTSSSYINVTTSGGRWGGGAIRLMAAGTGRIMRTIPARSTVILGFAGYLAQPDQPGEEAFLVLYDEGSAQLSVHLDLAAGHFRLYRGFSDALLAESDPITIASGVWSWFELKATIDDTNGYAELRRDGTTLLSFTGDTRATANSAVTDVQIRSLRQSSSSRTDVWLDDVYIGDDQGGANDDFLGDLRISTLAPTADTAQKDWTPSSGSDHFSRVAEIPPDDDASWVASATPGDRDLYAMAPLGMTPLAIKGLQQTALARKDDAGDRALSLVLKSGAAIAVAPATTLGSSYAFMEAMHEQDPATGAPWTAAAVDAVQAGIEVAP